MRSGRDGWTKRSGCTRASSPSAPDTEDAYRKLALVYWRRGRPADAIATLEGCAEERRHAERSAHQARPVPGGVGAARQGRSRCSPAKPATTPTRSSRSATPISSAAGRPTPSAPSSACSTIDPKNGLAWENIGTSQLQTRRRRRRGSLAPARHRARSQPRRRPHRARRRPRRDQPQDEAIEAWKRAIAIDAVELNALYNLTINLVAAGTDRMKRARMESRFIAAAPQAMQTDVAVIRRALRLVD